MALTFIHLEKAYDSVIQQMAMAMLRWMGIREADFGMLEDSRHSSMRTGNIGGMKGERRPETVE